MTVAEMKDRAPWASVFYDDIEYRFGDSDYIDDVVIEIASDRASNADCCDIEEILSDYSNDVDDIIDEFGWDGVGKSIRSAAVYALERRYYDDIRSELCGDLINCAINYLWENFDYEDYPEELYDLIVEWCNDSLNDRMDDVSDNIDAWIEENMGDGEFDDETELNDILGVA